MPKRDLEALFRQYYPGMVWRQGQREIVERILSGDDVLAIMPTGSGKSLCYQLPALALPGMTLVVSPLIALMKDQVKALRSRGIAAAYLNRSLDSQEYRYVLWRIGRRDYDLLYIAPERLQSERFWCLMQETPIALVAVDEAHCVSMWGHDFRPDYLRIRSFIQDLPQRPVVAAFTATAGFATRADIIEQLGLQNLFNYCQGFDRPNLYLGIIYRRNKFKYLRQYLRQHPQASGIIYCATRRGVDELSHQLRLEGFSVRPYHAGMNSEDRHKNQEVFLEGACSVMVATNAFGMGIDRPDLDFVIHYQLPLSLDAYYQELGRAGRDGRAADCLLLYHERDQSLGRFLIDKAVLETEGWGWRESQQARLRKYRQLERMDEYAWHNGCLRHFILDYFGEESPVGCGNCSVCCGYPECEGILARWRKLMRAVQPRNLSEKKH